MTLPFALLLLAQTSPLTYYCEDGALFSAAFSKDSATLSALGQNWTLPAVPAASGARYSDSAWTLHTKGDSAFVERAGARLFSGCLAGKAPANLKALVSGTAIAKTGGFPAGATLTVRLADVSRMDAAARVLSQRSYPISAAGPVAFEIPFDAAAIDPRFRYSVSARVESGGRLLFTTDTQYRVITGHPNRVTLTLVGVSAR